jgi:hypothetical protein
MNSAVSIPTSRSQRLAGAAAMFVFLIAVGIGPLCAALAFCSMPCCSYDDSAATSVAVALPACGDCSVSEGSSQPQTTFQLAAGETSKDGATVAFVTPGVRADSASPRPGHVAATTDTGTLSARPLHVLNSVFRI